MKTLKIYITGVVQGVFFRKFLEKNAKEMGLKGFCRNLDDGRVEIVIEGADKNVNEMAELCKKGSRHSDVKNVTVEDMNHQGFDSFKILSM